MPHGTGQNHQKKLTADYKKAPALQPASSLVLRDISQNKEDKLRN